MPRTGLLMVSFGEPAEPTPEATIAYLERIFLANASLDADADDGARRRRSRELAERRAPDLLAAYRRIGGSPLNAQAQHQAAYLHNLLVRRGLDTMVSIAMQYTPPTVDEALNEMMVWGAERIVAFPVYPLCGTTTTLAALDAVAQEARRLGFAGPIRGVSGWHADSAYTTARAAHIGREAKAAGFDLRDPDTLLYFSAHGTPLTYIAAATTAT
jgi:ferrochelatase